jgi:hypothetical protein
MTAEHGSGVPIAVGSPRKIIFLLGGSSISDPDVKFYLIKTVY